MGWARGAIEQHLRWACGSGGNRASRLALARALEHLAGSKDILAAFAHSLGKKILAGVDLADPDLIRSIAVFVSDSEEVARMVEEKFPRPRSVAG